MNSLLATSCHTHHSRPQQVLVHPAKSSPYQAAIPWIFYRTKTDMTSMETDQPDSATAGVLPNGASAFMVPGLVPHHPGQSHTNRQDMYDTFQSWALQNYGDSGKTKTVTRKKYNRIVRTLTGQENANSENSKFRFWVKAKGFRLGPPPPDDHTSGDQVLYVPTRIQSGSNGEEEKQYKRVAIVDDFFDIIYNVHVEMDGRGGKHAGQKRTYRAIAETYSFLPREAVTRFLMSCSDCQKRMHLSLETNNNETNHVTDDPPIIDFSMPITTTYLNHMRSKKPHPEDMVFYPQQLKEERGEDSMSSGDSEVSPERSPSPHPTQHIDNLSSSPDHKPAGIVNHASKDRHSPLILKDNMTAKSESDSAATTTVAPEKNGSTLSPAEQKPLNMATAAIKTEDRGHPERKRRLSNESLDSSTTKASESANGDDGPREDEEDEDNEEDEKLGGHHDPERLKAFNMFVRLFVDENLDRMVPISKQPKDKIQAILDACDRQFPEFHERSRKRIRTYLKSCRRMRRSKENGWESLRPTPPHLTSAAAESILAQACENESNNAKRMRMGLEPLPVGGSTAAPASGSAPSASSQSQQTSPQTSSQRQTSPRPQPSPQSQQHSPQTSTSPSSSSSATNATTQHTPPHLERPLGAAAADYLRHATVPPTGFRPPHELPSPFFANSNGIFRPGFPTYQPPAHHHPPVIQHTQMATQLQNGTSDPHGCPTDLSMKKSSSSSKNQLNPSEVATIKQLIAGYRESAAFLYRSADELEQLLLQQN